MSMNDTTDKLTDIRFNSRLAKFLVDTMATAVDRPVLCCHDNLDRALVLDISSEARDLRDDNNDLFGSFVRISWTAMGIALALNF